MEREGALQWISNIPERFAVEKTRQSAIRKAWVRVFTPLLDHWDREVRKAALGVLAASGPDALAAASAVAGSMMADQDASVRAHAARALEQIVQNPEEVFSDAFPDAKNFRILLGAYGDVGDLNFYLTNYPEADEPAVRNTEEWEDLLARGRAAVPALIAALADSNPRLRLYAAKALGALGADARAAVADLNHALRHDKNHEVRGAAAEALLRILEGSLAPESRKMLEAAVRMGALSGAEDLDKTAEDFSDPANLLVLFSALGDENSFFQKLAAKAFGRMGPGAADAVPALFNTNRKTENFSVMDAIDEALQKILGESSFDRGYLKKVSLKQGPGVVNIGIYMGRSEDDLLLLREASQIEGVNFIAFDRPQFIEAGGRKFLGVLSGHTFRDGGYAKFHEPAALHFVIDRHDQIAAVADRRLGLIRLGIHFLEVIQAFQAGLADFDAHHVKRFPGGDCQFPADDAVLGFGVALDLDFLDAA
jgi:HEAT repeat protein